METMTGKEGELLFWAEGLSNTTLGKVIAILTMVLSRAEIKDSGSYVQNVLNIGSEDLINIQSNKNEIMDVLEKVCAFFEVDILSNRHKYTLVGDIFGKPENKGVHININPDTLKILNFTIQKIQSVKERRNESSKNGAVFFDADKALLCVQGKEVKFRKFTEQYHSLKIIFEKPEEILNEWMFSLIAESIDAQKEYTDKSFHNYFSGIKRKVATETGIKDLFITTTQSVKINSDYL